MKETVRLNFDFPKEVYPYLKLMCAKKGISFKELATELILAAIDSYEDTELSIIAQQRLEEMDDNENVSFKKAIEQAGWEGCDKEI